MSGDLHTKVQNSGSQNKDGNKIKMGYTVNKYDGVLAQLQRAYITLAGGDANAVETRSDRILRTITVDATNLGSISIGSHTISSDGFVVNGTDYEKYRQQQVVLSAFMPFVVDMQVDGLAKPHYIPYKSPNEKLNDGTGISGKCTFPIPAMDDAGSYCDTMAIGVGSHENDIHVGIAVDLTDGGTVDSFFNKCYNEIYSLGCGGRAAAKNALLAEVAFVNDTSAATLHAKVIANSGANPQGKIHTIYLPLPLLLTSDFKTLAKVSFQYDKEYVVGVDGCEYPLVSSKYNHTKASLSGFTPKYIKNIVTQKNRILQCGNQPSVTFNSVGQAGVGTAYIRFYLQKDVDIQGVFKTDVIPDKYKTELYKGVGEANVERIEIGQEWIEATNAAVGIYAGGQDTCLYQEGQVNWDRVRTSVYSPFYEYKDVIESVAKENNLNTRLLIAHSAKEAGYLSSTAWKTRFNPAGLLAPGSKKKDGSYVYPTGWKGKWQGVDVEIVSNENIGVDGKSHGRFFKFKTAKDGWTCFARWVNNSSYYGVKTKKLKTVAEYVHAMEWGDENHNSFCGSAAAHCTGYAAGIMEHYNLIPK